MYECISVNMYSVYAYAHLYHMFVYVFLYMCIACACLCMFILCMFMYAYTMHVYICICVYVCVNLCVYLFRGMCILLSVNRIQSIFEKPIRMFCKLGKIYLKPKGKGKNYWSKAWPTMPEVNPSCIGVIDSYTFKMKLRLVVHSRA